ncbi:MAG: hypothetical protein L7U72_18160, partial [Rubripirellula sp.]|nr:hypothetical protein [Rubripirellula sp.]
AYQNLTSLALVHMPEVDLWSVDDFAVGESLDQPIRHLGINFGAPGDRRDDNGNLWLEYPIVAGDSPKIEIDWNPEVTLTQSHPSSIEKNDYRWIYASGLQGVTSLQIRLADHGDDSSKEENIRYRLTVFLAYLAADGSCDVELSVQGKTKHQHLGGPSSDESLYQRVEFSGVKLMERISLQVHSQSENPVIAGIEFQRE